MSEAIQPLLDKLEKARFTGTLELHFEDGQPTRAKLIHFLAFSELGRTLPTVEPEKEVKTKP